MFSEASVSHCVHRGRRSAWGGGVCIRGNATSEGFAYRRVLFQGVCIQGVLPPGGSTSGGLLLEFCIQDGEVGHTNWDDQCSGRYIFYGSDI